MPPSPSPNTPRPASTATPVLTYRGRSVSRADIHFIRELIHRHPGESRRGLSHKLCAAWHWVQPNGHPRDMVCRGLMLALHRAEHIELPVVRRRPPNPLASRSRPAPVEVERSPLRCSLSELTRDVGPIELTPVRQGAEKALLEGLIEEHHYLGYTQPVGEQMKYLVRAGERELGAFTWSSAPRHLGARDRYIGWTPDERRRGIHLIAYNPRFLILPWVAVPHLASHLLGKMVRRLSADWQQVYGHPVYFAETFVDVPRYAGTCYRAANWTYMGMTTGRGKDAPTRKQNRSLKEVLGYALDPHFRRKLRTTS